MGGVLDASEFGSAEYIIYWLINGLFFTCVNCFMLITGYFMCESNMKFSRLVKFWLQVIVYSVLCTVIVLAITHESSIKKLALSLVPLTSEQYWYATHYALILCFIPLLNHLIRGLSRNQFRLGLAILFLVFSIMPTFLVWERDLLTSGRDYPWMIVLYLTGAYIREYGLKVDKKKSLTGFVVCVLITGLVRTPLGALSLRLIGSDVLAGLFFRYNSVTVYLGAVLLFNAMLQKEKMFLEKVVLKLAPLSFAVYLIHDNPNVRSVLWDALPMQSVIDGGVFIVIPCLALTIVSIFLLGCCIEKVRRTLFALVGERKLMDRIDVNSKRITDFITQKVTYDL